MNHWVYVTDDNQYVLISVFPGEAGGADLYVSPETAQDIAKRLEAVARRVRLAFTISEDGDACLQQAQANS